MPECRIDLGAYDRGHEALQVQLGDVGGIVLQDVVVGGRQEVQPLGGGNDGPVPHGELEMEVKVRRDESRGVDRLGEGGCEVRQLAFLDADLLVVQRVLGAAGDVDIVFSHGNRLDLTAGGGHQKVLEASHNRQLVRGFLVGEVEATGQVDSGLVLQDLEGKGVPSPLPTRGQTARQDPAPD